MKKTIIANIAITGVIAVILLQSGFYYAGYRKITNMEKSLNGELEEKMVTKIEDYFLDSGLSGSVEGGTLTNDTEVAEQVTDLVMQNISTEYKNELKELVVSKLESDIEALITEQCSYLSPTQISNISESVKTIVMGELSGYTSELSRQTSENNNLYTTAHNTLNSITGRTDTLEQKTLEISSTYDKKIAALESADSTMQSDISTLKSSMKTVDTKIETAVKEINSSATSTIKDVTSQLLTVQKSLEDADVALQANMATLETKTSAKLADEISARKTAISDMLLSIETNKMQAATNLDSVKADVVNQLTSTKNELTTTYNTALLAANTKIANNEAEITKNAEDLANLSNKVDNDISTAIDDVNDSIGAIFEYDEQANKLTIHVPSGSTSTSSQSNNNSDPQD